MRFDPASKRLGKVSSVAIAFHFDKVRIDFSKPKKEIPASGLFRISNVKDKPSDVLGQCDGLHPNLKGRCAFLSFLSGGKLLLRAFVHPGLDCARTTRSFDPNPCYERFRDPEGDAALEKRLPRIFGIYRDQN
ncbi:MAG: hypothetical protein SOT69_01365 [Mesosutterella sp.]|nr:hypothetical protein [Mesosutterella sp.]